jgi:hypothetical protein
MSALPLAAAGVGHVVLLADRIAGAAVRRVRHGVEHILDAGTVSGLQSSVALDVMSAMRSVVVARRLVRARGRPGMRFTAEDTEDAEVKPYEFASASPASSAVEN